MAISNSTDRFNGVVASLAIKVRCVVGIESNVPALTGISNPYEGVFVVDGDRVLLTAQTDPVENGIWCVNASGIWARAADWDGSRDVEKGSTVWAGVAAGSDKLWQVQTAGVIQPGVTSVSITELFDPDTAAVSDLQAVTSAGNTTDQEIQINRAAAHVAAMTVSNSGRIVLENTAGDGDMNIGSPASNAGQISLNGTMNLFQITGVDEEFRIIGGGGITLQERNTQIAPQIAGFGYIWLKDDAPNVLMFTDDAGTDFVLSSGAILPVPTPTGATMYVSGGAWIANDRVQMNFTDLRVYEATITDYVYLTHSGLTAHIGLSDSGHNLVIENDTLIRQGSSFGIVDTLLSSGISTVATAGQVDVTPIGATALDVTGFTTQLHQAVTSHEFRIGGNNALTIQDNITRVNTDSGGFLEVRDDIGSNTRMAMTTDGLNFIAAATVGGDPDRYLFQPVSGGEGLALMIAERNLARADIAGYGQLFVRDDAPCVLVFRDDIGGETVVGTVTEVNDLSAAVTWVNVPDANITQSSVTQHEGAINHDALLNFAANEHFTQAAISIPASQISDFDTEVSNNASVVANTAKVSNVSTALSVGTVGVNTVAITSDGGADDVTLPAATVAAAGMLTTAKWGEIVANTAKVTNANHTGQVTGSAALSLAVSAITAQPASGAVIGTDTMIINDGGVLSEVSITQLSAFFGTGSGITQLTGDVTAGPGSGSQVATIAASVVTNSMLADMAADTVKVRIGSTGTPQDLAVGANTVVGDFGAGLSAQQVQTGQINNLAVSYAKMQNVTTGDRLLGRQSGGAGNVQEITLGTNLSLTGTTLNAAGGGGGIGGSITDNQVAVGATIADDIEGSTNLTFGAAAAGVLEVTSTGSGALRVHGTTYQVRAYDNNSSGDVDDFMFMHQENGVGFLGMWDETAGPTVYGMVNMDIADQITRVGNSAGIVMNGDVAMNLFDTTYADLHGPQFGTLAGGDIQMFWTAASGGSMEVTAAAADQDFNFRDGLHLRLWDSGDTDVVDLHHDGNDLVVTGTATATWEFRDLHVQVSDAVNLQFGTGNDARMYYDGVDDLFLDMNDGNDFSIRGGAANDLMIKCFEDAGVVLYYNGTSAVGTQELAATGVTSMLNIKDHDGNQHDVGFNNLRVRNDNQSDTLGAEHCGSAVFTDNSTSYTLTLGSNVDLDFPVHGMTTVINAFTSGNWTITEGASTTLYYLDGSTRVDTAGGCTVGPGGVANIWRESATVYYIWGTGITP